MTAVQFVPWSSEIELPFYTALSSLKIDVDRLDDSYRSVLGLYEPQVTQTNEESCKMRVLGNALSVTDVPANHVRAEGRIKNFNTMEEFKNVDKRAIIQAAAKQIWDAIEDSTIYSIPSLLSSFTILSFANLKKYSFTYWFAFPALQSAWRHVDAPDLQQLTGRDTSPLAEEIGTWRYAHDVREHGFFLAKKVFQRKSRSDRPGTPGTPSNAGDDLGYKWVIGSLREFERGFFDGIQEENQYVAFVDPSTYPENPGWMIRNYLVLIRRRFKLKKVQILCYRDTHGKRHEARSVVLRLETHDETLSGDKMPKVSGWERTDGKLQSKNTNLAQYMDPRQLADQAVDLNLKLMKWRIAPDLNLEVIRDTKCLLLGAGTLGTYVSRLLMGWGVRKITFVDSATVSFSNPVRQPLFDFKDCIGGGAKKAYRAAEALEEIYPGVESVGHVLSVPMLGHPIMDEQNVRTDFEILEKLMDEHDAIFLLMDTRESRWLPTVMGKAKNKIVLNAALGFDTWVVMRHGIFAADGGPAALGCYFCNDVVAPADSMKDQTLDQQCTVTRPGVAPTASAQLVEMLVSLLQHREGARAPAPKMSPSQRQGGRVEYERDPPNHPLGLVPHQIRGFAATFQNLLINGQSYDCCSACSPKIVDAYKRNGWEFIRRALIEKDYITELSGLAEVQKQAEAALEDVEWDSEPGMEDEGEGELL